MKSIFHCNGGRGADLISRPRLVWLDMAKGVMLLPAILEHTEISFMFRGIDNMILALFWMAAGYVARPEFSVRSRARSLLIPYLVMSVLCLVFFWTYMAEPFSLVQLEGLIYGRFTFLRAPISEFNPRLLTVTGSVLWFLPSFFTSYLVFKLLIRVKGRWQNVAAIFGCVTVTWLMGFLPVLLPWSLDTAPAFGAVIYCGRLLKLSSLMEKRVWLVILTGVAGYILLNYLVGATNISIGDFGNSVFLWFPAAVCGASGFMGLCSLFRASRLSRFIAWFNRGALFIFGMQLVFMQLAWDFYEPYGIDSWKIRILIVLFFCFTGGKLLSGLYNHITTGSRRLPNPM